MDPIGFALENFDADAKWRTKQGGDGGVPLDTSAVLWDGTKVNGPVELRQALLRYSPQFVRMITEKLMTFALGRGVEYEDMPVIRSIVRDADKDNDRFLSILMGIVKSAPFQMRTKEIDERWLQPRANCKGVQMIFITKKFIPRRTFLRGAGVTLGLPLLDSMVPAQTPLKETAAAPARRFVGIWHPHGAAPGYWSPLQEGTDFEFSFITKPLEPFRNHVTLITGLDMPEAMATTDEPGGDHARGAVLLSGSRPRRNAVSPYLGVTIDQLIAQEVRPGHDPVVDSARRRGRRQLRQLQLGLQLRVHELHLVDFAHAAAADGGESARGLRAPVRRRHEPRGTLTGRKQNASILDSVTQQISFFKKPLGAGDRARLDTYLENIREIERRIRIAMETIGQGAVRRDPVRPAGEQARPLPADVRPAGAGLRGRPHALGDLHAGQGSFRHELPRVRLHRRLARLVAPRRQAGERRQLRQDESVSRAEPGVLRRQAEQDSGRRRHAARSHPDLQGQQHGQLASARAREGAGDPARRHRRQRSRATATSFSRTTRSARRTCCWRCCTSTASKRFPSTMRRPADRCDRQLRLQHQADFAMRAQLKRCMSSLIALQRCLLLGAAARSRADRRAGRRGRRSQRPDGPVWEVIRKNCTACHGIDDYAFYAQDRAAWQKLIADKHKPGEANLSEPDRNLLLDWLAPKFGPDDQAVSREPTFLPRSPRSSPIPKPSAF